MHTLHTHTPHTHTHTHTLHTHTTRIHYTHTPARTHARTHTHKYSTHINMKNFGNPKGPHPRIQDAGARGLPGHECCSGGRSPISVGFDGDSLSHPPPRTVSPLVLE